MRRIAKLAVCGAFLASISSVSLGQVSEQAKGQKTAVHKEAHPAAARSTPVTGKPTTPPPMPQPNQPSSPALPPQIADAVQREIPQGQIVSAAIEHLASGNSLYLVRVNSASGRRDLTIRQDGLVLLNDPATPDAIGAPLATPVTSNSAGGAR